MQCRHYDCFREDNDQADFDEQYHGPAAKVRRVAGGNVQKSVCGFVSKPPQANRAEYGKENRVDNYPPLAAYIQQMHPRHYDCFTENNNQADFDKPGDKPEAII